jgi:two-component system cell cycle response regulator CtrA
MLELLSLRKGTPLSKDLFLNYLYGGMDEPDGKIIDVFICKLRKKLAAVSNGNNPIETVWGRGYVLPRAERSRCYRLVYKRDQTSARSRSGALERCNHPSVAAT